MSGQPYKNEKDIVEKRNEYLESLELQTQINEMNLEANRVYKATGALPPVSLMQDTRTVEQKLLDFEGMKISIIKEIAVISSPEFGQLVVQGIQNNPLNIDNGLLIFTAQRIKEIVKNLQNIYSIGIKGDKNDVEQFITFIVKMYSDTKSFTRSTKDFLNSQSVSALDNNVAGTRMGDYGPIRNALIQVEGTLSKNNDILRQRTQQLLPRVLQIYPDEEMRNILDNVLELIIVNHDICTTLEELIPTNYFVSFLLEKGSVLTLPLLNPNYDDFTTFSREFLNYLSESMPNYNSLLAFNERMNNIVKEFTTIIDSFIDFVMNYNQPIPLRNNDVYISKRETLKTSGLKLVEVLQRLTSLINPSEMSLNDLQILAGEHRAYYNEYLEYLPEEFELPPDGGPNGNNNTNFSSSSSSSSSSSGDSGPPHYRGPASTIESSNISSLSSNSGPWYRGPQSSDSSVYSQPVSFYTNTSYSQPNSSVYTSEYSQPNSSVYSNQSFPEIGEFYPEELSASAKKVLKTIINAKHDLETRNFKQDKYNEYKQRLQENIDRLNNTYGTNYTYATIPDNIEGSGLRRRGRPKGSGIAIKKPPKAYKQTVKENMDLTRGIEPSSKFIQFGKYLINNHKLNNDNIFTLKHKSGNVVMDFPTIRISPNLSNVFKSIVGGALPHINEINKLSEPEKMYLHKVCLKSNIIDKLNIPTPNKDYIEKELHKFEVMKGEIMSGNDNKDLIKNFKILIMKLSRNNILPKKEVSEILEELVELGY